MHLVNALNRGANIEEKDNYDKIREYINWTLSKKINGDILWINNGKITLSKKEVEKIINLTQEQIKKESFLNRRIWVSNYIQQVVSDQIVDNPVLVVSRNNILEDSLNQFKTNKDINLKRPLHVFFLDEDANDVGGVYREWFSCVFKEYFSEKRKLFKENNFESLGRNTIIINEDFICTKEHLEYYELFGKLVAKSLVDRVILNENLNYILLKQLMHLKIEVEDIKYIDMDYYISFQELIKAENIEQSDNLTFCWMLKNNITDELDEIELIPNGKNILLNESNQNQFLELYLKARSNEIYEQAQAIKIGLCSVIPEQIINFLTWQDFEYKICGPQSFDMDLLIRNTKYTGFKPSDPTIKFFWKFLNECTLEEKYLYLKFANGFSRLPKDDSGFNKNPHQITKMEDISSNDYDKKLPRSHTCFFTIDIPPYSSYDVLKEKMMYAMKNSMVISDTEEFLGLDI